MTTNSSTPAAEETGKSANRTPLDKSLYERLGGHDGILGLIRPFYADLRQHAVLGPVFAAHIRDWPAHLDKITDFWALQTGGPSRYRGGFGTAHVALGIGVEHFDYWLGLWEFNNARQLQPLEALGLNALARQLAVRLRTITQGHRPLRIGKPGYSRSRAPVRLNPSTHAADKDSALD
jgi:hemoglobin